MFATLLVARYNDILDTRIYIADRAGGIVASIFKTASVHEVKNDCPVTLISCMTKLFSSILNTKVSNCTEKHRLLMEEQAGFRAGFQPGYSTIDNGYVLNALIQKLLHDGCRLYATFVDMSSAFDLVVHGNLWSKLMQSGIRGNVLNIYENIWTKIKLHVRNMAGKLGEIYHSLGGMLQVELFSVAAFPYYKGVSRGRQ